jgi:F0F1-type ATP synthase delta subunit
MGHPRAGCAGRAQVEKDLANISKALSNATFARFVKDPCISRKDKKASMDKAVAGADETTRKLAGVYVCVCVRTRAHVYILSLARSLSLYTHTHTHTRTHNFLLNLPP